jgi:D-lactate dehydrogenase (cytochrome)
MDLIDLFIGSEGTLGLVSAITVGLVPLPGAVVAGLAFLPALEVCLELSAALRDAASRPDDGGDRPDVRSIEFMDRNCLELLRECGADRRLRVDIPAEAQAALLFEMELAEPMTDDQAQQVLADLIEGEGRPANGPLGRLFHILREHGALELLQFAFPQDSDRRKALNELREAVPTRVSEILADRGRRIPGVKKVGGDLIVPYESLSQMIRIYQSGFDSRGLSFAIWGHLSDGNLHPNALPRTESEVHLGYDALLEFADEAAGRGGCPLSEHGVGRSPIKQKILRRFLGDKAIASMRQIKKALDPSGCLAPGVLFPANESA